MWGHIKVRPFLPLSPTDVGTKFFMFTRNGSGEVNDVDIDKLEVASHNKLSSWPSPGRTWVFFVLLLVKVNSLK